MNITCNKDFLQKYIANANRITGKHLSLPILNLVFISTNKNNLIIRATNLEVGVEFQIPAKIKEEGSIALPGALLANTLINIPNEQEITLNIKDGVCKLTTKTKSLTIKGFPTDDFPTIPTMSGGESFVIPANKFIQGAKSVLISAAISDIKPEIASVYLYQSGNSLVFVATDSFRLAEKKIKQNNISLSQGIIIPLKNIIEIVRILELEQGDIKFSINKNQISCSNESLYITSRVVNGVYPDYEQILPKTNTTEVIILKEDLINTIKLSTLFFDKFNKITLTINPTQKTCNISTKNTEIGETESIITATLSGEPIEISLNGKHLLDCLSEIEKDSIVIQLNGADKPAVIRGLGDASFTYLTMPLTRQKIESRK